MNDILDAEPINESIVPHDAEAERAVLAAFMAWPREVGNLCAEMKLAEDDFFIPANETIFRHLRRMWANGDGIDTITLSKSLRDAKDLDDVGGVPNITDISLSVISGALTREHVAIVQDKALLRKLFVKCKETAAKALVAGSGASLLLEAQNALAALYAPARAKSKSFKDLLIETVESISNGDDATADIRSGIEALDDIVRMRRGNFVVIAGEAKSGKTALAGTILSNAAVRQGKRCACVSLEMTDVETLKRIIANVGKVNVSMMGRTPSRDQIDRVTRAATILSGVDMEVASDVFELGAVVSRIRQWHAKRPLDLVVLDYLQLAEHTTGRKGETRQEIVAQISRTCKRLAGELNCVFVALSQLNEDGKLRESRAIGQDANAIIAVEGSEDGGRVIKVVAQRNGRSNEYVPVQWLPQFTRFEDANQ